MGSKLYIINLSGEKGSKRRVEVDPDLDFGGGRVERLDLSQLPEDKEPIVLYIVGHALPDEIFVNGVRVSEVELVKRITDARKNNSTLIIWDLCHARSFERNSSRGWGGSSHVLIFACQSYEEAWHSGPSTPLPRQTLFSIALKEAKNGASNDGGFRHWSALEEQLRGLLEPLQRPSIRFRKGSAPNVFGLGSKPAISKRPPSGRTPSHVAALRPRASIADVETPTARAAGRRR
jgi:hypothetical protein